MRNSAQWNKKTSLEILADIESAHENIKTPVESNNWFEEVRKIEMLRIFYELNLNSLR